MSDMRTAIATLMESMQTIQEAVIGYRTGLERAGLSSAVCDAMTIAYHQFILDAILKGQKK